VTTLYIVLTFQVNCACIHGGEVNVFNADNLNTHNKAEINISHRTTTA